MKVDREKRKQEKLANISINGNSATKEIGVGNTDRGLGIKKTQSAAVFQGRMGKMPRIYTAAELEDQLKRKKAADQYMTEVKKK